MSDYNNGKIYKLIDNTNNKIYVGSTTKTLEERLYKHIKTNTCVSRDIIKNNDFKIELIEYYPCKNKQELLWRERYYIENNDCINKYLPITTKKEKKDNQDRFNKMRKDNYKNINNEEYRKKENERLNKLYHEKIKEKNKIKNAWIKSWGGDMRACNNNLLRIDVNLFN